MKKHRGGPGFLFSFLLVFAASTFGGAIAAGSADKNECADSAVACMGRRYEAADSELNATYSKLAAKLDGQAKDYLKSAERAWLKFRDANGELRSRAWDGGFAANPVRFVALADMTRERANFLKKMSGRMEDFPWLEKGCEKSTHSTPEYGLCVEKAFEKEDRELNQVYQSAMAKLAAGGKEALKKSQRAWLDVRDADAGFYADFWRDGTGYGAAFTAAKAGLTRARTAELKEVAKENS